MNIGILGGTFNPVHCGHLIVAEHVREEMQLERILFIPSALSPHKQRLKVMEGEHRAEMLRRALAGNASFEYSELELERGGVSFTIDTLEALRAKCPDDQFFLLIGMDNFVEFTTWKEPDDILRLAHVIVMTRPGFERRSMDSNAMANVRFCSVPDIEISSSEIRKRLSQGKSIRYLVPREVEAYIVERGLYRTDETIT